MFKKEVVEEELKDHGGTRSINKRLFLLRAVLAAELRGYILAYH